MLDAVVFPYKPDSQAPWDWDGDIPDWMIDVTNALADILASPQLKTAAEILEVVDEVGPLLLEGTTPPDPLLYAFAALDEATLTPTTTFFGGTYSTFTYGTYTFATLDTFDDTYTPAFNRRFDVDLFPGESFYLLLEDEDLLQDDYIGSIVLGARDLRAMSGCGAQSLRGAPGSGLYSLDVAIEALD